MLSLMRKHAKNWLMKVILGIIIIVFIFYFGSMRGRQQAETVAVIDNNRITYAEYQKEYQNLLDYYYEQYGADLTDDVLRSLNLKQRALDNLIDQIIILSQADLLNLEVSDAELRESIYSYPVFQRNGVFDKELYERRLRYQRLTPEEFESIQKRMLTTNKLERLIKESVKVSEQEVFDIYTIQNEQINVEFLSIRASEFLTTLDRSEDRLKEYFDAHVEDFRVPETIFLKYVAFRGDDYARTMEIPDSEIADYYSFHQDQFTNDAGVVTPLEEVTDDIKETLKQMKGLDRAYDEAKQAHDIIYQEENFQAYAAEHKWNVHEIPVSSAADFPEELAALRDLSEYVFTSVEGDLLPVVSDEKARYLFWVERVRPSYIPDFADARKDITEQYTAEESRNLCMKKGEALLEDLKEGADLADLARTEHLTLSETGFFIPNPEIPGIGYSPDLGQALYELREGNPYPDMPYFVGEDCIIVKLKEAGKLDDQDWNNKKALLARYIRKLKEEHYFKSWLDATRQTMIDDGLIKIVKNTEEL